MDFASALKDLEQTADAAVRGGRGGGRDGGGRGGGGGRDGGGRGGGGGRDGGRGRGRGGGDYYHYQEGRGRGGGRGYPPRGGGGVDSRGGRGGGYNNSNNNNNNNNERRRPPDRFNDGDRRFQPRPRLDGRGGGDYGGRGEYGGGRGRVDYGGGRGGGRGSPQGRHHRPHPLDEMREYGYHIDPYKPPKELPEDLGKRPFHICLLAIVVNSLPYEHIWRHWAASGNTNSNVQVSLLVHAKYPDQVESDFVKRRLITKPPQLGRGNSFADPEYLTHTPAWGSVQITRAMVDLLRIGHAMGTTPDLEINDPRFSAERFLITPLKNYKTDIKPADKFLFLSETCLPVQTLQEFEKAFFGAPELYQRIRQETPTDGGESGEDTSSSVPRRPPTPWELSWMNARNRATPGTPKNKYESDQFASIHRMLHGSYRWKADQWLCLSRLHAAAVLNVDGHKDNPYSQMWNKCFRDVNASDEMYFPSVMAVLQILTPPEQDGAKLSSNAQVALRPVTYTDWSEGMRNPATFSKGILDLNKIARLARQQESLVARKFALQAPGNPNAPITGAISVEQWTQAVQACQNQEKAQREQQKQQEAAGALADVNGGNEATRASDDDASKDNEIPYDQTAAAATNEDANEQDEDNYGNEE